MGERLAYCWQQGRLSTNHKTMSCVLRMKCISSTKLCSCYLTSLKLYGFSNQLKVEYVLLTFAMPMILLLLSS
jgi:hypothetical protein